MINEIGDSRGTGNVVRTREEHFIVPVGGIDHLVFSTDGSGNFTYINPNTEAILGYSPAELAGINVMSLVSPPDRDRLGQRLAGVYICSSPLDVQLLHKDGSSIPARSVLWTMVGTGKIADAPGIVSDSGGQTSPEIRSGMTAISPEKSSNSRETVSSCSMNRQRLSNGIPQWNR